MRTRLWLSLCLVTGLMAVSRTAQAQYGPAPASPDAIYAAQQTDPTLQGGGQYSGLPAGGYPPNAEAWPYLGAYGGPVVNEHQYQNGFWYDRPVYDTGKKFYFTMSGMRNWTARPADGFVGAHDVPFTLIGQTANNNNNAGGNPQFVGNPARTLDESVGHLTSGGLKGEFGWWNPDGSGFFAETFWADKGNLFFQPFDLADLTDTTTLRELAGLPLHLGSRDVVMQYDALYQISYKSQIYGAGVGGFSAPFINRDAFKVRPVFGGRVMSIREDFAFHGINSGNAYTQISTFNGTGNNNNNNNATGFFQPTNPTLTTYPIDSTLDAHTQNFLAGPDAGFRMDIGGEKLHVALTSKFGLLANNSQRNINSKNIGDAQGDIYFINGTGIRIPNNINRNNPAFDVIPNPAVFGNVTYSENARTFNLSPMFEQSMKITSPIFQFIPVIRKISLLEKAQFEFGYTFLMVGSVYRPEQNIVYEGYPLHPRLANQRDIYMNHQFNFGIEWTW